MNSFSFPTNINFGPGVVAHLPAYLKEQSLTKPLIVTDPVIRELPFFNNIIRNLEQSGLAPLIYSDISRNPLKTDVIHGKKTYNHNRDCVIGLGGGAALDVSRAVALSINHHRDLFDYDSLIGGHSLVSQPIPHFITIPTTSGTGSEVGRSAVISEDDSKKKRILFHPSLMAKQVFADPELTYDLPPEITAATGMDALTHHIEAFLARGFHPMCDAIALEGIRMILNSLDKAVNNPDEQSRSQMMLASLMGGVAFQKGLGIVHSLSHPLSTVLDMHHGLANAVNLPYGMEYNISAARERFDQMAPHFGLTNGEGIPAALKDLNQRLGLPVKLSECGVKPEHVDILSGLAVNDFCLPLNPKKASLDDIKSIYHKALS